MERPEGKMRPAIEYIRDLERAATEFALSTPLQTKTGLVVRKHEETGVIVWQDLQSAQLMLEALMQNGGEPIGFISVSDDASSGKLKVASSLLEECNADPTADYTLSRVCRGWAFQ